MLESGRNTLVQAYNDQRPSERGHSRREIARSPDARRTVLATALPDNSFVLRLLLPGLHRWGVD